MTGSAGPPGLTGDRAVRRVSVVGCSGSGKSHLARRIAARLDAPHLELNSVYHQADWTPLPEAEFLAHVHEFTAGDTWVTDGNYSEVTPAIWARADTVVWLDLPRATVMRQVTVRTLRRVVTREQLWNGNRERFGNLVNRDPEQNIILWSWTRHAPTRARYAAAMHDPAHAHLTFVRCTSRAAADHWLATVGEPTS